MNSPVILITGAGKGIGKAIVEDTLDRADAQFQPKLVLTSRTSSDLEALKAKAKAKNIPCEILPYELSDDPTLAVKFTAEKFGALNQLIHSAGVGRFGNFLELTANDLEFTMKTNVEASFLLMQSAFKQMQSQRGPHKGDIVWITSVAAEKPFDHSAIYCMSKYAQKGLIDVMRLYARKEGIRVIDVKPGAVLTPMWGEVTNDMKKQMMMPEDIARIICDVLSIHPRASVEDILIRPIGGDL